MHNAKVASAVGSLACPRYIAFAAHSLMLQAAAVQDAKVALAYSPRQTGAQGLCKWPWAHALHAAALEGLQVRHYCSCSQHLLTTTVVNPSTEP